MEIVTSPLPTTGKVGRSEGGIELATSYYLIPALVCVAIPSHLLVATMIGKAAAFKLLWDEAWWGLYKAGARTIKVIFTVMIERDSAKRRKMLAKIKFTILQVFIRPC